MYIMMTPMQNISRAFRYARLRYSAHLWDILCVTFPLPQRRFSELLRHPLRASLLPAQR